MKNKVCSFLTAQEVHVKTVFSEIMDRIFQGGKVSRESLWRFIGA